MSEQREILEKLSSETLRDMVVDLGNALEGYKESFAIVTEELEKWKNGSKKQADKIEEFATEILVLKAELITERLLGDKLISDRNAALSKADFWRVSHDAACEDAKNWRRDAQELQGTLNDILADLQGRNIHLLSKHCWCEPTGHPWTQKGTVAE